MSTSGTTGSSPRRPSAALFARRTRRRTRSSPATTAVSQGRGRRRSSSPGRSFASRSRSSRSSTPASSWRSSAGWKSTAGSDPRVCRRSGAPRGGRSGSGAAEAEIAVVGGAARANGQNDFAGANVKGKIALVTGPVMPGGGSAVENAYAEGAAGVLVIGGATIRYSPIPRLQSATIPTLVITEDVANDLLAASGKKVSDEQAAVNARRADPNAPDSGFDVPTVVHMSVSLTPVHDVDAFNVVGLLRAPDPDAAKRAVMVGGHLDGVGTDPDGSVFQAANDNASGPAVVVEMARALSAAKASLRHSILFVAFAGEEEGLLGSEAYAAQTAVTPGRVESLIAMIDLDVIGCCGSSLIVSSEAPELQKRVRDAATKLGISSQPIGGGGSDQTTFVRRRVPAVFVGWSDYILHTYKDVPAVVDVAHLKKAGDVLTAVAKDLATAD